MEEITQLKDEFYRDLEKGNAVMYQQARNNIMLALTSKTTESIMAGDDTAKVNELLDLMANLSK